MRWRVKLQRALALGIGAAGPALGVWALILFGVKLHLWSATILGPSAVGAGGLVILAILGGLARRVDDLDAAWRLDRAGELHERLSSAVSFTRRAGAGPLSPMEEAALRDAARHVEHARPELAAPWSWPRRLGWVGAALVAIGLAWLLHLQAPQAEGLALSALVLPAPPSARSAELSAEDRERLAEEAKKLAEQAKRAADPDVRSWIDALNELLRQLQAGELTPEEAHTRMARLEKAKEAWEEKVGKDLGEVAEKVKEAAQKKRPRSKHADPLFEALREERWADAARAMKEARAKADKGRLSQKEQKRFAKDMRDLAKRLESERQKREREAKRDRDRLKKKQKRQGERFSRRDRDRLEKRERQLERLQRQQQEMSEAGRQLERLERNLGRAAADLMRRLSEMAQGGQMSQEDMKRAEDILRRLSEMSQGRRQMRVATARLVDIEEMLRRAGGDKGKDGKGQGAKDRFMRLARGGGQPVGKGKGGKSDEEGKGDKGEDLTVLMPGGKGGKKSDLLLLGQGQGSRGRGAGQKSGASGEAGEGEGAGTGHDRSLYGGASELDAKPIDSQVSGVHGEGPSQSRVVSVAAKKGFASAGWKAVHQDYREVVEEDMERQHIPAGQRRYVRRYFDLIRPR